jgi:hypothetical protein
MNRFTLRFDAALIPKLAGRYVYPDEDKMLKVIGPKANKRGYFTKDEFKALCLWKTARSQSRVDSNPAAFIEEATRIALATPFEEIRIGVLNLLHGVSWPTASTVLHFAHQDPYPILDYRALWSLSIEKQPQFYTFEYWWDYTKFCRDLAEKYGLSMRVLDRALWQYSKENQPPQR